jgi:hypothetical protein
MHKTFGLFLLFRKKGNEKEDKQLPVKIGLKGEHMYKG